MKNSLAYIALFTILSCRTKTETKNNSTSIQLIIPDTTNNRRAQVEFENIEYYSKIAKQLGLSDLKKGVDSFEIRAWYSFSFSNSKELYIVKQLDSTFSITYCRFYLKEFDPENRDKNWNPFTQPIMDSNVSKSIIVKNVDLKKGDLKKFDLDNAWSLRSQSELKIPDYMGFTDCDTYTIELADKKRYKFLAHHCPHGYFDKLKLQDIANFMDYFDGIRILANKNNVVIPFTFD